MPLDIQDLVREVLTNALQPGGESSNGAADSGRPNGRLSGVKGLAAGAGAAALAPVALKGAEKLAKGLGAQGLENAVKSPGEALGGVASKVGDRATSSVKEKIKGQVDEAGGPGGMLKDAAKSALPFGGGDSSKSDSGGAGVGKGRRMPIQQSVDIGIPIETVYNQFTQFEEWPNFMHRVTRVTQEDDCTVSFSVKIWAKTKEFTAKIETQRPDERIKWRVTQGMDHVGVVTFHELEPRLTRVLVDFDVQPGSLVEKFARGARHVKRAARGDLHRFKAFIEMAEQETGAWRGVIEDGELVEEHDPSYDQQRQYADTDEVMSQLEPGEDEDQEDEGKDSKREAASSRSSSARGRSRKDDGKQRREGAQSKGSRSRGGSQASGRSQASKSGQTRGRSSGATRGNSSGSSGSGRSRGSGSSGSGRSRSGSAKASSGRGTSRSSSGGSSRSRGRRQAQSSNR